MNLIAAVDEKWGIGLENSLLFSIPQDKAFFKQKTVGKVVVMGRKTLESLPDGMPLTDRTNIVLSESLGHSVRGAHVCNSIAQLNDMLRDYPDEDVYVIGGERVYKQLADCCSHAFITRVHAVKKADAFFPNLDALSNWHISEKSEIMECGGLKFSFIEYKNTQIKTSFLQ